MYNAQCTMCHSRCIFYMANVLHILIDDFIFSLSLKYYFYPKRFKLFFLASSRLTSFDWRS